MIKMIKSATQSKIRPKNKKQKLNSPRAMWDYNKKSNIYVIRIPGDQKGDGNEKIFEEIMTETLLTLKKA